MSLILSASLGSNSVWFIRATAAGSHMRLAAT